MLMNIDFNEIKNSIISAYQTASVKVVEWSGRAVAVLKSGTEVALPYLQDKRIAVASLIGVTLILIEIGIIFGRMLTYCVPKETNRQIYFCDAVETIVGLGILGTGVAGFSKYANLPLGWPAIAVTTGATLLVRALCETRKKETAEVAEEAESPKLKGEVKPEAKV